MLVAEVQTPSDTTYRVFDFKRKDPKTGQERELHVDQALECIDFAGTGPKAPPVARGDGRLVAAPQFTMDRVSIRSEGKSRSAGRLRGGGRCRRRDRGGRR